MISGEPGLAEAGAGPAETARPAENGEEAAGPAEHGAEGEGSGAEPGLEGEARPEGYAPLADLEQGGTEITRPCPPARGSRVRTQRG